MCSHFLCYIDRNWNKKGWVEKHMSNQKGQKRKRKRNWVRSDEDICVISATDELCRPLTLVKSPIASSGPDPLHILYYKGQTKPRIVGDSVNVGLDSTRLDSTQLNSSLYIYTNIVYILYTHRNICIYREREWEEREKRRGLLYKLLCMPNPTRFENWLRGNYNYRERESRISSEIKCNGGLQQRFRLRRYGVHLSRRKGQSQIIITLFIRAVLYSYVCAGLLFAFVFVKRICGYVCLCFQGRAAFWAILSHFQILGGFCLRRELKFLLNFIWIMLQFWISDRRRFI